MGDLRNDPAIFALPTELLLAIFDNISTRSLLPVTPTCRRFHTVILRLIHNRLVTAAGLKDDSSMLYLQCHPPSTPYWLVDKIPCSILGTTGLEDLSNTIHEQSCVGQIKGIFGLFTRFQPSMLKKIALDKRLDGDAEAAGLKVISGASSSTRDPTDVASLTVNVDNGDEFCQLVAKTYLVKRDAVYGLPYSMRGFSDGILRVWRGWLATHCEIRRWTDGEPIVIHHDPPKNAITKDISRTDSIVESYNPNDDPNIRWSDKDLGIRMRVKRREMRQNHPRMDWSDSDGPVSYHVEFDEVVVRTMHLLGNLEEAEEREKDDTSKTLVLGRFRGSV